VSDDLDHGATTIRPSRGHYDGGGGGAKKWLIGGIAAVVLTGGAYAAWKTIGPGQQPVETAYNEPYDDSYGAEPARAGPLGPGAATGESASADESVEPAAPEARSAAPARSSTARSEPVPEETIGVTPANVTTAETATQDSDDIIVRAPPRPVWSRTPSARRLTALYPARALERGREGEVQLHCAVLDGGALNCATVSETPGGFGNAALRVARTFRHAPTTRDGADAVGTPVNLRVVFRIEDERRGGRRYASNY
jgi:TonB family protein